MVDIATLVARVVADTSGFNAGMAKTESRLVETAATMRATGRVMTMALTLPILAIAAESVKFAIGFQQQMEMIHTQAGSTQTAVNELTKSVIALAPATRYGPEELAKALYHIESVSSGAISNAQAMNILKVATEGAAVGNANLEDTASALVGTMRVFHEPASAATKVMGELNAIVGAGNMRMTDLNAAIATGIMPTARALGLGIKDVGAGLALMTDESTHASVAATRMRTAMLMATGETKKSRDALDSIGIGSLELAHLMNKPDGLVLAMADLNKHLEAIPDKAKRAQVVAEIFGGARSSGTILQFLNNLDMMQQKFDQINKTAKNFPEDVLRTQATDAFKLHQAWAGVQTVMIQMGGILAPVVVELAQGLSRIASLFSQLSPAMQQVGVFGALAVAAIGPLVFIFGALISPVGLVVAAIIALAAAGVYLYEHYQKVRDIFDSVKDAVMGFTDAIGLTTPQVEKGTTGFGHMNEELVRMHQISNALHSAWTAIAPSLANAFGVVQHAAGVVAEFVIQKFQEIVTGIKAHSAEIVAFLTTSWNAVVAVARTIWPYLKREIEIVWDAIKIIVTTTMKVIGNVILAVMDLISGNWHGAWEAIKNATRALLTGIVDIIRLILTGVVPLALSIATRIGKAIADGILKVVGFLASLPGKLLGVIGRAISATASAAGAEAVKIGTSIMQGVISGVGSLAGDLISKLKSTVTGAISGLAGHLGIHSPSTYTRDLIGIPMADGIIRGLVDQLNGKLSKDASAKIKEEITAISMNRDEIRQATKVLGVAATKGLIDGVIGTQQSLAQQMKDSLRQAVASAIASAKQDAQSAMSTLMSTFSSTANSIIAAFNQQTSAHQTQAGKDLTKMQLEDQIKQYQDAINTSKAGLAAANKELADSLAGGDPVKIKDAQDKLSQAQDAFNAAVRSQQEFNLSELAKKQQAAWDALRKKQEEALAKRLVDLQKSLAKHPEEYDKINKQILAVMAKYNIPMFQAGQKFIDELAAGLTKQIPALEAAAKAAAEAVAKYLRLHSPAEAGPLSTLDTWFNAFAPTLLSGFNKAAIEDAVAGATSLPSGRAGAYTPVGSSLTERGNDAPTVHIQEQHIHNDLDARLAAIEIGRAIAFR